jgi:CDP-paratose 2-epimerase
MKVLITGGAGFIGSNLAAHFTKLGHAVTIYDNFSRRGSDANLEWLQGLVGAEAIRVIRNDIRQADAIAEAARGQNIILHLAGQVAVTTSVNDPRHDFEANALGTFNVMEAARQAGTNPIVVYSSTNKVYGGMEEARIIEGPVRYGFADLPHGVPETWPLDFHSPYGCSKGAGDQYVRDYQRIYGLPTVVFRQSAIYGPRQFGVEDQGWLAFFAIRATIGKPFSIYGDGKQVRDLLHIDDLVRAFELAITHINQTAGQVYNIGGGPERSLSVWTETRPLLEALAGRPLDVAFGDWRPGDQRVYLSDIRKAKSDFGWEPRISPEAGLKTLWEWTQANKHLFS